MVKVICVGVLKGGGSWSSETLTSSSTLRGGRVEEYAS